MTNDRRELIGRDETPKACPLCGGREFVCRPVLDMTVARHESAIREADPDLWFHFHCCEGCRVAWLACATYGDDLGVVDSERHDRELCHYRVMA